MKAIILAGGYAKRFWPVTLWKPKPLLPVAGKPILDWIMEKLEDVDELDTVYVSTNAAFQKHFERWAEKRKHKKKVEVVIEPSKREEEKFGTIKALDYVIKKKKIKTDLMVVAGDNIFSFSLKDFVDFHPEEPRLILYDMKDKSECSKYGVVSVDAAMRVTHFEEKPDEPKSSLIGTACYVFPAKTLKLLREYLATGKPVDNTGSFLEWLYRRTTVRGFITEGYWYDIGNKEFYINANIELMNGRSMVKGKRYHARVNRSYVGPGSTIKNSALKECVVFDNVHVENCALTRCVIDDHARIENVDLSDSLVSAHSKLTKKKIVKSRRFFLPPVTGQELLS
jgi:glucose-1-phosphate thymidylyltransferase